MQLQNYFCYILHYPFSNAINFLYVEKQFALSSTVLGNFCDPYIFEVSLTGENLSSDLFLCFSRLVLGNKIPFLVDVKFLCDFLSINSTLLSVNSFSVFVGWLGKDHDYYDIENHGQVKITQYSNTVMNWKPGDKGKI